MHNEIRKFSLEGLMAEPNIVDTKDQLVRYIEDMMRDYSFVPSIDLDPQFTLDYSPEDSGFKFTLSVYGVQVEKEKAWSVSGITNGKEIPRYTRPTK